MLDICFVGDLVFSVHNGLLGCTITSSQMPHFVRD